MRRTSVVWLEFGLLGGSFGIAQAQPRATAPAAGQMLNRLSKETEL
jgi:hypothetical protein